MSARVETPCSQGGSVDVCSRRNYFQGTFCSVCSHVLRCPTAVFIERRWREHSTDLARAQHRAQHSTEHSTDLAQAQHQPTPFPRYRYRCARYTSLMQSNTNARLHPPSRVVSSAGEGADLFRLVFASTAERIRRGVPVVIRRGKHSLLDPGPRHEGRRQVGGGFDGEQAEAFAPLVAGK